MALFAKEAAFYRFWVFFRAGSLQNEVGDPHLFYISDITNSSSFNGKISRKKSMLEKFGANVLKSFHIEYFGLSHNRRNNLPEAEKGN